MHVYFIGTSIYLCIYHLLVHVQYNLISVVIFIGIISKLIWWILVIVVIVNSHITFLLYEGNFLIQ